MIMTRVQYAKKFSEPMTFVVTLMTLGRGFDGKTQLANTFVNAF